jgi:hypothetical protein
MATGDELVNPQAEDGVTWDDLFGHSRTSRSNFAERTEAARQILAQFEARQAHLARFRATAQRNAETLTPRMREQIEKRKQDEELRQIEVSPSPPRPEFLLDWYDPDNWRTPEGTYKIREMVDQHLWTTLIWCVRNVEELHRTYDQAPTAIAPALAARYWLKIQTAFRALLQEALRRQLTFPRDVTEFISKYMLNKNDELTQYEPWNDPAARLEQKRLQEFLHQPVKADEDYGKEHRAIDL